MTTTYASPAESAKALRSALREQFPSVKFSVTLSRGAGSYGNCSVRWTDGPSGTEVYAVTTLFAGQEFDAMTDSTYSRPAFLADGRRSGLGLINLRRSREVSA